MKKRLCISLFACLAAASLLIFTQHAKGKESGSMVRVGLGGPQPMTLDSTKFGISDMVTGNVSETLIYFNTEGKMSPRLAESWAWSKDGKSLTMNLRKGVKFSSGSPFTARDVVFSLEKNKKNNMPLIDAIRTSGFQRIDTPDDYTAKFIFTGSDINFQYSALSMLYIVSETDFNKMGEKAYSNMPTGTGPYKYTDYKAGQYIDLEANEFYWGKKPQIKKARILMAPSDITRVNMLKAGEADIIMNTPWENVKALQDTGFNVTKVDVAHAVALLFGLINNDTPWANLKVRQAINYCIDKDMIIKNFCYNIPKKIEWMFPWELGYDASLKPAYPYNLQKAKQLMKEAGYENGFELPIIFQSDLGFIKNTLDYISNSLKQININCKLTGISAGPEFFGKLRQLHNDKNAKTVLCMEIGGPGNPDSIINLNNQFYSNQPTSLYSNPEADALIKKGKMTIDVNARKKLIQQAYKIVDKDLPAIQILADVNVFVTTKNLVYKPTYGSASAHSFLADTSYK